MATNITAQVIGSTAQVFTKDLSTVQEVANELGLTGSYSASINGEAADMNDSLDSFSFVSFSEKVKGGF